MSQLDPLDPTTRPNGFSKPVGSCSISKPGGSRSTSSLVTCRACFVLLCLVLVVPAAAQVASTPEQRFFDWTALQFDKEVYAQRRARLIHALQHAGGGVFIAPSAHGVSHGPTFRQLDDFLYFTGLELPHSLLAIDADAATTTLFTPGRDARFESTARPNDFPGRPLDRKSVV